ncbi:MAG: hypothetical protein AUK26_05380 [Syntrophaceae bacterium CG2_30_58_14]|nr:MAG: hypothetical protein AUK26_05380 [Syntrophaceae bacterium CG2_30_58_14]
MTTFLWSFEKLARLCDHKDPEVNCWAADRIPRLYPKEAGPLMAGLLSDRNESVAAKAAAYFCDDPDRNFADALLAAFRKSSGIAAKRLGYALALMKDGRLLDAVRDKHARIPEADPADFAGVLMNVALLGTDESQRYVEDALRRLDSFGNFKEMAAGAFFNANIEAGTDIGKLLLFAYHSGVSGYVPALLAEIVNRAGGWCPVDALAGKSGKGQASKVLAGEVEASLALLARTGCEHAGNALEKLLKKRRFDEILEEAERTALVIRQAKRLERGEEAYLHWQGGRDVPFFHCAALTALKETAAEAPKAQRETVAGIAVIVLAFLAESRSLIALNPEILDADAALEIFFEDRPDAPQDEAIMDLLARGADVKNLVREAVRRVGPFAQANGRMIRFAGRFIDEGLARELLAVDFDGNGFEDDVAEAVGSLGSLSIPLLRPFFEKNDPAEIPLALRILENLSTEAAVDLILSHWSLLWGEYKESLLDAVERIGDKRFIPALKTELREGEQAEGETFRLLCLINGEADPELERIKREMELREEREKRLQGAIKKEDMGALLREPLEIPLQCRACRNVYHYTVNKVFVAVGAKDTVIEDHIVCKKCGALDHYQIANDGMVAVTARLALLTLDRKTAKMDREDTTVVPMRSISAFGKEIPLQDLLDKYEKKLRKSPESPELLVGFANALRQIKRREDSVPFYERAIKNDPLTVEGYASLGEYAFDKGDLETAFSHYSKAAEIMDRGHYYRVRIDLDQFKEGLLDKLMMVAERLGRGLPHPGDARPGGEAPLPARPRPAVGRNQPCPCGSGKKYKKCCLLKESGQAPAPAEPAPRKPPAPDPVFQRLRKSLSRYVEREISRNDFLRATGIFWNIEPLEPIALPERASEDKGQFHDWFINDYRTVDGKTILEGFCDRRLSTLSAEERRLADSLMKSYESIYEVQAVREGEGLTIRDLFTGETMNVAEVSGSYEAVQWDLVQVRIYRMDGKCRFGGNGQIMPRRRIEALKAYLDNARRAFQADTGHPGWPAFLKENAFRIGRFFDESVDEPPMLFTEERHRIISSKAHFTVSDYGRARKLLSREYDFTDEEEIPSGGVSFSWLKRGPSKEWEMGPESDEKGVVATSSIVHPSGQMTFTVLGTVNLYPDRLILECMSRERLERGKKRLQDLMPGTIRHRIDEFEDIHVAMERREGKGEQAKPLKNEKARAMLASVMQKYMFAWPDQALPALGGKTPREAAATKAGREKVLEFIKDMENGEARKKKAGEPSIDLGPLRRELGIGRDEG